MWNPSYILLWIIHNHSFWTPTGYYWYVIQSQVSQWWKQFYISIFFFQYPCNSKSNKKLNVWRCRSNILQKRSAEINIITNKYEWFLKDQELSCAFEYLFSYFILSMTFSIPLVIPNKITFIQNQFYQKRPKGWPSKLRSHQISHKTILLLERLAKGRMKKSSWIDEYVQRICAGLRWWW